MSLVVLTWSTALEERKGAHALLHSYASHSMAEFELAAAPVSDGTAGSVALVSGG